MIWESSMNCFQGIIQVRRRQNGKGKPPKCTRPSSGSGEDHDVVDDAVRLSEDQKSRIVTGFRENAAAECCTICSKKRPNVVNLCCGQVVHVACMARRLDRKESCNRCHAKMSSTPMTPTTTPTKRDERICSETDRESRVVRRFRENAMETECCTICLEEGPNAATLCCGQVVHIACMAKWLSMQNTKEGSCHWCRAKIPSCVAPTAPTTRPTGTITNLRRALESRLESLVDSNRRSTRPFHARRRGAVVVHRRRLADRTPTPTPTPTPTNANRLGRGASSVGRRLPESSFAPAFTPVASPATRTVVARRDSPSPLSPSNFLLPYYTSSRSRTRRFSPERLADRSRSGSGSDYLLMRTPGLLSDSRVAAPATLSRASDPGTRPGYSPRLVTNLERLTDTGRSGLGSDYLLTRTPPSPPRPDLRSLLSDSHVTTPTPVGTTRPWTRPDPSPARIPATGPSYPPPEPSFVAPTLANVGRLGMGPAHRYTSPPTPPVPPAPPVPPTPPTPPPIDRRRLPRSTVPLLRPPPKDSVPRRRARFCRSSPSVRSENDDDDDDDDNSVVASYIEEESESAEREAAISDASLVHLMSHFDNGDEDYNDGDEDYDGDYKSDDGDDGGCVPTPCGGEESESAERAAAVSDASPVHRTSHLGDDDADDDGAVPAFRAVSKDEGSDGADQTAGVASGPRRRGDDPAPYARETTVVTGSIGSPRRPAPTTDIEEGSKARRRTSSSSSFLSSASSSAPAPAPASREERTDYGGERIEVSDVRNAYPMLYARVDRDMESSYLSRYCMCASATTNGT